MEENTAFKALINPDGKPIFPKNLDENLILSSFRTRHLKN